MSSQPIVVDPSQVQAITVDPSEVQAIPVSTSTSAVPAPIRDRALRHLTELAEGAAKGLYQVSTPGIAASLAKRFAPEQAAQIPETLQGMDPARLPNALMTQGLLSMTGAAEVAPEGATAEQIAANRAAQSAEALKAPTESSPLYGAVTKFLTKRIPFVRTIGDFLDLADAIKNHVSPEEAATELPPPTPTPKAPAVEKAPTARATRTPRAKTASPAAAAPDTQASFESWLKTPQGQRFAKIYEDTKAELTADVEPKEGEEEQSLSARKPPTGTVIPQTAEEMEQALHESLRRVQAQRAAQ